MRRITPISAAAGRRWPARLAALMLAAALAPPLQAQDRLRETARLLSNQGRVDPRAMAGGAALREIADALAGGGRFFELSRR